MKQHVFYSSVENTIRVVHTSGNNVCVLETDMSVIPIMSNDVKLSDLIDTSVEMGVQYLGEL